MSRRFPLTAVLLIGLLASAVAPMPAAEKAPVNLDDLAWLAGHWRGMKDGDVLDEQWSAPAGGALMGMFRWIKGGRVQMYEFLTIETDAEGRPVLLLRHFNAGLIAWEDKDTPWRYPLTSSGPREAVFTLPNGDTRMTFRRPSEDTLIVLLERRKDGQTRTDEFNYTRVK